MRGRVANYSITDSLILPENRLKSTGYGEDCAGCLSHGLYGGEGDISGESYVVAVDLHCIGGILQKILLKVIIFF